MMTQIVFCILAAALALICHTATAKKCRALALEGGGDKGAYEAGVIQGLVNNLDGPDVEWDVVSGISVGAINLVGVILFPQGEEKKMAEDLVEQWREITPHDIYKNWPGGILQGIFSKPGILDNTPMYEHAKERLKDKKLYRKFTIGATDARTGSLKIFNESYTNEELAIAIHGSTSLPGVFPPVEAFNASLIDGGCIKNVDIASAITRCREIVSNDADIIIDVVLCTAGHITETNLTNYHSLGVFIRFLEILSFQHVMGFLSDAQEYYPKVNFRYLVMPNKPLPSAAIPIKMNKEDMEKMIQRGNEDAKEAIGMGEGKAFSLIKEFSLLRKFSNDQLTYGEFLKSKSLLENNEFLAPSNVQLQYE